eukprot:scaffold4850_cov340-Prasinococcus_capsulatus_cf.AAC.12
MPTRATNELAPVLFLRTLTDLAIDAPEDEHVSLLGLGGHAPHAARTERAPCLGHLWVEPWRRWEDSLPACKRGGAAAQRAMSRRMPHPG